MKLILRFALIALAALFLCGCGGHAQAAKPPVAQTFSTEDAQVSAFFNVVPPTYVFAQGKAPQPK